MPILGEVKFDKFIKNMQLLEGAMNFKMVPDIMREDIKVFTEDEEVADLVENSKYNKKHSKSFQAKIEQIKQK